MAIFVFTYSTYLPTDYLFPKDIVLTKAIYKKAVLEANLHLLSIWHNAHIPNRLLLFISNRSNKPAQDFRSL